MYRVLRFSGRRRPLTSQTFATLVLVALASVVGVPLLSGASAAATSQAKPVNTSGPTISGSAQENARLQADPGTWSGDQPITFTFRWLRCSTTGGDCIQISGAKADSYVVRSGDVGKTLRVRVTARNDAGSASASRPVRTLAGRVRTGAERPDPAAKRRDLDRRVEHPAGRAYDRLAGPLRSERRHEPSASNYDPRQDRRHARLRRPRRDRVREVDATRDDRKPPADCNGRLGDVPAPAPEHFPGQTRGGAVLRQGLPPG